jgi:preprotein translocase subunit SecD
VPLAGIVILSVALLTTVLVKRWTPYLGLDLQGGASVVYQAANDVPDQALDDAIGIIRSRVDALGVAEPEIVRQGDAIVVDLPGIEDRDRALEVIGRTAELEFRPVLASQPYLDAEALEQLENATTSTTAPGETTTTTAAGDASTTTTSAPAETTTTSEAALALVPGENAGAASLPRQEPTTTTAATAGDASTTTTTAPGDASTTTTTAPASGAGLANDPCALLGGTTPPEEATPDAEVVFPADDPVDEDEPRFCYRLGPIPQDGDRILTGRIVSDPEAVINNGEWGVSLDIRGDDLGLFNQISSSCFNGLPNCPSQGGGTGQLAIALDGEVQSALGFRTPTFDANGLLISGSFSEREAKDLALVLRFGSLPVELEPQSVREVSATLGEDSLQAGLVAGFIGVGLVLAYLFLYYRALGLVVVLGLMVWSALNWSVISWLGETQGLALSLAGVTGIVVSVGVTVDSYVVYFERLKDEVRSGKTVRSSVDRSFQRAFRTILTADVSSLIGALILYVLTVGPVRGFAFFLGLSTLLDIVVAYFFTRPLVASLGRTAFFTRSRTFGVARGSVPVTQEATA